MDMSSSSSDSTAKHSGSLPPNEAPAAPIEKAGADAARGMAEIGHVAKSVTPAVGPWADTLGRVGSRAGQAVLIAAVVVGLVWVLLRVKIVVIALLVALILAAAVGPAVRWLERKGWSNLLATLTAFIGILVLIGGLVTGIVFSVRSEWGALTTQAAEGWAELRRFLTSGPLPIDTAAIDQVLRQAGDFLTSGAAASGAISGISAATQFLTGAVLMIVILFFFLKDGAEMWNFILRWFRGERRAKFAESIDRGSEVLGGYVRGTAAIASIDAILIGGFLLIAGVPLAIPLAVIAFVTAFIPVVGATVAGIVAALVALVTNGPIIALALIIWIILVNQIEGNVLQPIIMGRTLSLHPLLILLALAVGTIVGGIFGAILAVPYTAVGWAVIQVWATGYQTGYDPALGKDPLNPDDRIQAKATMAQRFRYEKMRLQQRRGGRLGATEQGAMDKDQSDAADSSRK